MQPLVALCYFHCFFITPVNAQPVHLNEIGYKGYKLVCFFKTFRT